MSRTASSDVALASIQEVGRAVEQWRATRARRGRMPEDLWTAAVGLARKHGLYQTSRGLRVSYDSLKSRLTAAGDAGVGDAKNAFVELRSAATPVPATMGAAGGTVIELSSGGAGGAQMVVRLADGASLDMAGLAAAFWSRS